MSPSVVVHGVRNASFEAVRSIFREDGGRSLYNFPAEERRRSLLAVDWVREATVARLWPRTVEVSVREREPVAYVQRGAGASGSLSGVVLIDEDGVILAPPPRMDADLPILTGISDEQTEEARAVRVGRAMALIDEIGDFQERVSVIDVSDASNMTVTVDAGERSVALHLGREQYRDKMASFFEHWPEIHRRAPEATDFDLRLDDRITALNGVAD
jgi:cell division protein FtsQ